MRLYTFGRETVPVAGVSTEDGILIIGSVRNENYKMFKPVIADAIIVPGYREEWRTVKDAKTQMLIKELAERIVRVVRFVKLEQTPT